MRNKKKLGKMIALALMLGSCAINVTEASGTYVYGNSPNRPSDYITRPSAGDNASEFVFDFDSSIHAGTVWTVYGGYAINVDALSNTLNFNSGTAGGAYAGYVSGNGNANANKLTVTDGSIEYGIFGGYSDNGASNNNEVTVNGGRFPSRSSGYVGGIIIGGQSRNENANNNTVTIKADINGYEVRGGYAYSGNSNNNTVNIMAGADNIQYVLAGEVEVPYLTSASDIVREYASNSNKVIVDTNANIHGILSGYVNSNNTGYKVSSSENKIVINNGNINSITASLTRMDSFIARDDSYIKALNNSVILNNGTVRDLYIVHVLDNNSYYMSSVTRNTPITIYGNSLTINGGDVGDVHGILDGKAFSSAFIIKNNSINIKGGVVQNIWAGDFALDNLSTIEAQNNTVNWYAGDINGSIYGYRYSVSSNGGVSQSGILKDSTFNFFASRSNCNKKILSLGGFENYNFYLDKTVSANATLINLSNADLRNSNVGVAVLGSSPLQEGDSVTLLSSTSPDGVLTSPNLKNDTSHMTAENISTVYDFTLRNQDNKKLIATVSRAGANPKAENLMGIRSAEAFMTYDKVDVVDKAYQASKHTSEPTSFIEYGYSDVTTKDDTKLRGSNAVWGIASTIGGEKDQANTLTRGIFFEYGDSSFASTGHYPTGSIYGYGKGKKIGLGVLARKVMFDRHYYDAYLRAGSIKTDYDALAEGVGNIKYDNRDMYFSGNLGYGQFIQLTPNLQLDTYIKYFYNRIPGHSTTAYANGVDAMPISFDVFENHRFRLGSKFTWDYMESNNYKWYADVALEQEFAKDQSGSINSHRISKSNGSSTTGVIELCYENKFGANNAFMFTAKAQGYVGDRRGLGASANLSFSF